MITSWINIALLLLLLFTTYLQDCFRKDTISIRNSRISLTILIFFSGIDFFVVIFNILNGSQNKLFVYPWLANFLRPGIFMTLDRKVRNYTKRYLFVISKTLPMVIFIVMYVIFFASSGVYLYAGTIEGSLMFSNFWAAFFNIFITLTTSNFPNVMLPAYGINRLAGIFFLIYLLVGLFLLMNLLLAIFYSSYQTRGEQLMDQKNKDRTTYFRHLFNRCDTQQKGWLDEAETQDYMNEVHSVVIGSYSIE